LSNVCRVDAANADEELGHLHDPGGARQGQIDDFDCRAVANVGGSRGRPRRRSRRSSGSPCLDRHACRTSEMGGRANRTDRTKRMARRITFFFFSASLPAFCTPVYRSCGTSVVLPSIRSRGEVDGRNLTPDSSSNFHETWNIPRRPRTPRSNPSPTLRKRNNGRD
jgi:hypothetical protein